jgi:membrane-anchored glycerophosphoryl diester phosphodiesterase (GDPDase)
MWLLKGFTLAVLLLPAFAILYLLLTLPIRSNAATGLSAIYGHTIYNPIFLTAVAFLFAACCLLFRLKQKSA